jgi:transcriptional regulator with XRE-family HTH domain
MTTDTEAATSAAEPRRLSPSDTVAVRIREERTRRGWTATQLAERCTRAGATKVSKVVMAYIEGGRPGPDGRRRRDVTVDELLMFADALDVAPLYLMSFPREASDEVVVMVNPTTPVRDPDELMLWMRGDQPLPGTDSREYFTAALQHMPMLDSDRVMEELRKSVLQDRAKEIVAQFRERAEKAELRAQQKLQEVIENAASALESGASTEQVLTILRQAGQVEPREP